VQVSEIHFVNLLACWISTATTLNATPAATSYVQSPRWGFCELHVWSPTTTSPVPITCTCRRTSTEPSELAASGGASEPVMHRPVNARATQKRSMPQIWPLVQSLGESQLTMQSRTAGE
jgi:hypothetical protein